MGTRTRDILIALVWLVAVPTAGYAQASIAGVVRDTSGAVMPGVTVEAASPALIEQVRTVGTDGTGQYRVVDLRPGTYSVTFTLPGFNTIKREGIELAGSFTATINAEMRVGALEETVTVTGESPTVDIQSTRQQQTIDRDIITAIPTGRAFQSLATLVPAMVSQGGMLGGSQDVGGDRGPWSSSDRFIVHGGLVTDSRILVEGLGVASASAGGASGTYYLPPVGNSASHLKVLALYAQDQWTVQRLTLQGSIRYDNFSSDFPDQQLGPTTFVPDPFIFPGHEGVNFNDFTARGGAAYDLFGTGKTALKIHLGKYMQGQESTVTTSFGSALNPITRLAVSTNRSWNDANRNYFPDCNLANSAANGECGPLANQNFGKNVFSLTYDPEATHGWGVRPYSWEFATSIQHEIFPRVAVDVGYFRRWFGNFAVTDNLATTAEDYTRFNLPMPIDPRLPNSGSTVNVANINPNKFGQVNEVMTTAGKYGQQVSR